MTVEISFNQQVDPSIQVNDIAWTCDIDVNGIQSGVSSRVGIIKHAQNYLLLAQKQSLVVNKAQ